MRILHLGYDLHLKRTKPYMGYFAVILNMSIAYRVGFSLKGTQTTYGLFRNDLYMWVLHLGLSLHLKVSKLPKSIILKTPCMWVFHLGLIIHLKF
jgi:hypothetical protein